MVLSFFRGKSDEELALRSSLSKESFLDEFGKALETFGVTSTDPSGKNEPYGQVEAMAQFLFEHTMKAAIVGKTINTKKDLDAAAMLGVVLIHCLGRNTGMSKTQLQFLLGKVPAFVFARTLTPELSAIVGDAITKSIIKYAHKVRQKRFRHNAEAVEENITNFLTQRSPDYYVNLAGDIARFH
jgi:hypothetical protein